RAKRSRIHPCGGAMRGRVLCFVVGTTAEIYTTVKARRLAYRLTPAGLADQLSALGVGHRAFTDEVRTGMTEREAQIAEELGMSSIGLPAANPPGWADNEQRHELTSKDDH